MEQVVCILGMHRSGTSCLAGSLEESGLFLGPVNTAARFNQKGNRENPRIWQLHDAILAHSGGTWARPPARVQWTDAHRAERDSIIASYANTPRWGFKDPRALLAVDFWREAIADLRFVGTFRHPDLVARSLFQREGRDIDHWREVWGRYNERLLSLHAADPFPIVRFDLGEDAYRRSLATVVARLGLAAAAEMAFFDADLRHQTAPPPPELPEHLRRLYDALCRVALEPG